MHGFRAVQSELDDIPVVLELLSDNVGEGIVAAADEKDVLGVDHDFVGEEVLDAVGNPAGVLRQVDELLGVARHKNIIFNELLFKFKFKMKPFKLSKDSSFRYHAHCYSKGFRI